MCKLQPKLDESRLDTKSKENFNVKPKYSLEKTQPHTNELSKLKTEHTATAVVNKPNINESSMFSSNLKNHQIPYKSKYKLRKCDFRKSVFQIYIFNYYTFQYR